MINTNKLINMKTKKLALAIVTFAMLLLGSNVMAQVTGTGTMVAPTGNDATDTVTIGSVMPYRVTGDINMHSLRTLGILNHSNFTKTISAGGSLLNEAGIAAPLTTDTAFSVSWTVLGAQSVTVREVPVVASGPAFACTAADQVLPVRVVARPTAAWAVAGPSASGCGVAGTTVTIPYTAVGTGQFNVTYRITYTNLAGTVTNVVAAGTAVNGLGAYTNGSQSFNFSYAVPALAYGRYDVYIENLSDRISRKSGVATIATTDYPTTATTFYAYPTPVTAPINHIQNL